jgi:DNA topoisomerase-1
VKKGKESRSLASEDELFTVTLEEALALISQPKQYGRRRAAPVAPLRELGVDPVSERPVVVREGRFGPYVTDGETNASLRRGDTVDNVTVERAAELLQARRDAGPPAKGRGRPRKATGTTKKRKPTGS